MFDRATINREDAPTATEASEPASVECGASRQLWVRLAWYLGSIVFCCVLIVFGLRLEQADLNCPLSYNGDTLQILPLVKSTVERGFGGHWRNERLGAPGILELYDFPIVDHLHFLLIWLMSKVVPNLGPLYNLYYLLTYPLTSLTAMLAFRQLRLSLPAAAVGGLLYAFLPYHHLRGESHYFLAAYWLVPLSLLPILAICAGDFPFYRRRSNGRYEIRLMTWGSAAIAILAAATASAGAYYAFFTCAFSAFAGAYGAFAFRKWQAVISSAVFIALIAAFGAINQAPAIHYQKEYGSNPVAVRFSREADLYGLKIAHLVLPIDDHNLGVLARLKGRYNSPFRPEENENKTAALGLLGSLGLIGLLVSLLLPIPLGWPSRPLAALTAFGVLLATLGGFGSIFNLLVLAQIRAYNRISVFIAFFCLVATLSAIDRFLAAAWADRLGERWRVNSGTLKWVVWPAVLLVGLFDQTPHSWFRGKIVKARDGEARQFRADRRFFAAIEQAMPQHASIFCLPYTQFPEPADRRMTYEQARGYLHTGTLCWSYGAMKCRETDAWQIDVAFKETDEFLRRIVYRGFDGLWIDQRGYPTARDKIDEINRIYAHLAGQRNPGTRNAHLPEIVHEDGQEFFLDLRPYREELRALNPSVFDAKVREEQEWVAVIWLNGFWCADPPGKEHLLRWGPANGDVWVINPSERVRKFQISMTFQPNTTGKFHMKLSGLVDDEFRMESTFPEKELPRVGRKYLIEVKPGREVIQIQCTPPPNYYFPEDNRSLCYQVMDFKIEELK